MFTNFTQQEKYYLKKEAIFFAVVKFAQSLF